MMTASSYRQGMRLQLDRLHARLREGMPRRGWKIGINVPEVQRMLGLEHSVVGWIDGDKILESGACVSTTPGRSLHVEPEICFRMASGVPKGSTAARARYALAGCAPALEIVDYAQPKSGLEDVLAHSMFHYATVLGEERSITEPDLIRRVYDDVDFRVGGASGEPRAGLVPDDVGTLVSLVADSLAELGEELRAGDLILSGAFAPRALPLRDGDSASARLGPMGEVRCEASSAPPAR